jgi:hypothetical protein
VRPRRSPNWIGSSLFNKFETIVEVTYSDKHSSVLLYGCKMFYSTGPRSFLSPPTKKKRNCIQSSLLCWSISNDDKRGAPCLLVENHLADQHLVDTNNKKRLANPRAIGVSTKCLSAKCFSTKNVGPKKKFYNVDDRWDWLENIVIKNVRVQVTILQNFFVCNWFERLSVRMPLVRPSN